MNTYTYVGNNPLAWIDPFGLTRRDIQEALEVIRESQLDLPVPVDVNVTDLPGDKDGNTSLIKGDITLDSRFLEPLSDDLVGQLLETLMHEVLHRNQTPLERWVDGNFDKDHPDIYKEAFRRTTQDLIDELNKRRKENVCQ